MLTNDTADSSQEQLAPRTRWNAAMLGGILSAIAVLGCIALATMPNVDAATRGVSGALAVVGAAGVWAAVRGHRSGSGKFSALALVCALGSIAALVVLRMAG